MRALILAVEELKAKCAVPATLKEIIGADKEGEFFAALDEMAENAFDDQARHWCTLDHFVPHSAACLLLLVLTAGSAFEYQARMRCGRT